MKFDTRKNLSRFAVDEYTNEKLLWFELLVGSSNDRSIVLTGVDPRLNSTAGRLANAYRNY